jgi:hypothetical protein
MKPNTYPVRAFTGVVHVTIKQLKAAGKLFAAVLFLMGMARQTQAQSYTVTRLWSVGNGTANLVNDNNNRGLAYNVISNQVYIAGRTSAAKAISVLDGTSGAVIAADFPNISIVPYNVGVADDGVIYGVPLANGVNANNLNIYSWTNWNSLQRQCYAQVSGDAASIAPVTGQRVGDSFAIFGGGTNTLILLPINTGTANRTTNNMLLFSTTNGQTFLPTVITISGLPIPFNDSGPEHGVAFINSSNFLFRPGQGSSVYLISFPANFASLASPVAASVIATNTTLPSAGGSDVYLFSYSPAGKLLADYGQILSSAGSTALGLYDVSSFPIANALAATNTTHTLANGNFTGGVALGGRQNQCALCAGFQQWRLGLWTDFCGGSAAKHFHPAGWWNRRLSALHLVCERPWHTAAGLSMAGHESGRSRKLHKHPRRIDQFLHGDGLAEHQFLPGDHNQFRGLGDQFGGLGADFEGSHQFSSVIAMARGCGAGGIFLPDRQQ